MLPTVLIMAEAVVREADVAIGVGRVGGELHHHFSILQRMLKVVESGIDLGAEIVGADVFRIELDRLCEVVQSLLLLPFELL